MHQQTQALIREGLTTTQRIALRKLFQTSGVKCNSGEEQVAAGLLLSELISRARDAGGEPPAPARPNTNHVQDLQQCSSCLLEETNKERKPFRKHAHNVPDMTQPFLLTADEAARLLNLSRSKVYKLCDERDLAHYRLGEGDKPPIRIPLDAIDEFLARARVEEAHPRDRSKPLKHIRLNNPGSEPNRG